MRSIPLMSLCLLALLLAGIAPAAGAADDSVTVIARFYAAPGREGELEARIRNFAEFAQKIQPNITFRAYRSKRDPSVFIHYEVYPSQAAFDKHAKETLPAFRQQFGGPAEGLFARPPEVEFFRSLKD